MVSHRFTLRIFLVVVAVVGVALNASAETFQFSTNHSAARGAVGRDVMLKGTGTIYLRSPGTTTWSGRALTATPSVWSEWKMNPTVGYFTGGIFERIQFNTGGSPETKQTSLQTMSLEWTRNTALGVQGTVQAEMESQTLVHTLQSGLNVSSYKDFEIDPVILDFGDSGPPKVEDPYQEAQRGEVMLLFNNESGEPQDIQMGDQNLHLAPGWNTYRYQGDLNNGFPANPPQGYQATLVEGSDGRKWAISNIRGGIEGPPVFVAPSGLQIPSISGNSNTGSTIFIPGQGGNGGTFLGLPPVPNRPIPPTAQNEQPWWPKVTHPSSPPPVKPPTPNGGGGGGTPVAGGQSGTAPSAGGTGTAAPGTSGEGGFYNAEGVGDLSDAGKAASESLKQSMEETAGKARGVGDKLKIWDISEQSIGKDYSWLSMTVNMGSVTKTIEIKRDWVDLIRAWLLLGVKVGFVWSVIKLYMH